MYKFAILATAALFPFTAQAGEDAFTKGPVFEAFGPVADIEADYMIPAGAAFKVSFDVSKQADAGGMNRSLVSVARFINMHARAGVPLEKLDLAIVIHGGAVKDASNAAHYEAAAGGENANAALVEALTGNGVQIIVCGQSAVYYGVGNDDLLPGVQMALSAMTAHALLQQGGYTLNPF